MLVFIDESGDPGFKLAKGSSPNFVTTMVIFDDHEQAKSCQKAIYELMKALRVKPEFKFSKLYSPHRDTFFEVVGRYEFRTRSVVVQKELIYSDALRTVKESFYKFFVRNMLQHDGGALVDAKVVVDGSGDRAFKRAFRSYLRRHLDSNAVKKLELRDSVKDPLVQLADMTAGAIARSYNPERADSNRWRSTLRKNGQIENVWEFR
ncbi:DUF3800 domain-containing protein [Vannielia litorea]|uniref:DUF3800 domain-containing protein n=1 Tax=Vannielia litorea TaxID=1217970 RepID=UPI001C96CE97|nr:DUF3800 domain-containing protein [Vannielia litorea]MBY6047712.1 DUF3800 domain-containing protein [Vannielia litorea]MBY6075126.1 DUF3800 domain-containing protein [Vannielia litorea]